MKVGVDTNVLVYAFLPSFAEHARVRRRLLDLLQDPEVTVVVTAVVLHELVHVITDARRFDPPVTMNEALAVARLYVNRTNVECVPVDQAVLIRALDLLERHELGRKRIADTLFAAALLGAEVDRLMTCNPSDFQIFDNLVLVDPRVD